jgi:hypothetical protein
MAESKQKEPHGIGQIVSDLCGDLVYDLMPFPIFLLVMGIVIIWAVLKRISYSA